jgi:long-chain acyl-CoA synthetase
VAVSFWALEHAASRDTAVVDASSGARWTYGDVGVRVAAREDLLQSFGRRLLGVVLARNNIASICTYLAALRAGHPVLLIDATLGSELVDAIFETYRPDWIFSDDPTASLAGYARTVAEDGAFLRRGAARAVELHEDLALLLSTSGSTGSPKLVRLSKRNVETNAAAIAEYLALDSTERAITSLPMAYSYGLSVINSHLAAGATLVLTSRGVLEKDFWVAIAQQGCTSLAGVPYTYQMLLRFGLLRKDLPALRTLTQAGGRLDVPFVEQMDTLARARGWRFVVMYGQTEASPRISYVPPGQLSGKLGSIGVPIPGGALRVDDDGELVYTGPNVMLGYAEREEDLARGDELGGVLRTGDLGRRDEDGFFYVTGRRKRFLKLFGQRFGLDEIEKTLGVRLHAPVACVGADDRLAIVVAGSSEQADVARRLVTEIYSVHHGAVRAHALDALPVSANGKTDYQAIARLVTP